MSTRYWGITLDDAVRGLCQRDKRIAELEGALRRVVRDVNDYEEANKLSPNPGRTECWDSVAHAKTVLAAA